MVNKHVRAERSERIYADNTTTTKSEGGGRIKDEDSKHRPNQT